MLKYRCLSNAFLIDKDVAFGTFLRERFDIEVFPEPETCQETFCIEIAQHLWRNADGESSFFAKQISHSFCQYGEGKAAAVSCSCTSQGGALQATVKIGWVTHYAVEQRSIRCSCRKKVLERIMYQCNAISKLGFLEVAPGIFHSFFIYLDGCHLCICETLCHHQRQHSCA